MFDGMIIFSIPWPSKSSNSLSLCKDLFKILFTCSSRLVLPCFYVHDLVSPGLGKYSSILGLVQIFLYITLSKSLNFFSGFPVVSENTFRRLVIISYSSSLFSSAESPKNSIGV